MGLASSQARMLLLTARKSDLEYRAQMISQRKINLAMQTQTLAQTYSQALNDKVMKFTYTTAKGESQQELLSYKSLTTANENFIGDYLVKTSNGNYAASSDTDRLAIAVKLANANKMYTVDNRVTKNYYHPSNAKEGQNIEMSYKNLQNENYLVQVSENAKENAGKFLAKGVEDRDNIVKLLVQNDGKTFDQLDEDELKEYNDRVIIDKNNTLTSSDALGQAYADKNISVVKFNKGEGDEKGTYDYVNLGEIFSQSEIETQAVRVNASNLSQEQQAQLIAEVEARYGEIKVVAGLDNSAYFQDALRNGGLFLFKQETQDEGFQSLAWSADRNISDVADSSNDAQAQADYEAKSLVLSNQDKMLDLELNQIETQHKAIETERDSVKKVIEKNIDVSYKIFA